jgi:integrase
MPKWGKAYFLLLATSGMRPSEALQLKINDIELDKNPPKVLLRAGYTKTGNSRFTFMSSEAKEALVEYLKGRNPQDDRIFPYDYIDIYRLWRSATKGNGLRQSDPQSGHQLLHPYTLRKFFRTNLGAVSNIIPVDVIEALMGHELYLRDVYKKYSDDQIADLYLRSEHAVLVFSSAERIKDEMRMNSKLENLVSENHEFKRKISETDKILGEVLSSLEQLKAQV